ncbi:YjgN family protein [Cupriavidus sp. NPDC089707]|uniref:YjgN family protein n=1 Tax=Cupriavidus sp. NPDC089707 TaxID=3363963 RepID=UPI00382F8803
MHAGSSDFTFSSSAAFDTAPASPEPLRLSFTGSGSEYFRIWIVNVLLTIVTFGIYSAWAKVRTLQYFYRNTRLDGASFDYHGKPSAILKGRAIVFGLALAFQLASNVSPFLALAMLVALLAVFPLLLVRSLRFRMANSSYRGLRFAFTGGDAEAYKVFVLWPLAAVFTLGLLGPLAHQRFKQYQHNNMRFGTAPFGFAAGASEFYGLYLRAFGVVLATAVAGIVLSFVLGAVVAPGANGLAAAVLLGFAIAGFYLGLLAVSPYLMARLQNVVWNHTTLAPHAFRSQVGTGRMIFIFVTNLIAIALTLGLYLPFARVRATRYRVESVTLLAASPLDNFVAGEIQQVGALGDAAVDWYDIDIAL